MSYILSPTNFPEMLTLRLDASLVRGIEQMTGVPFNGEIPIEAATTLTDWADNSENPTGQKANLVRAIAGIITAGDGALVKSVTEPSHLTFWDLVSH